MLLMVEEKKVKTPHTSPTPTKFRSDTLNINMSTVKQTKSFSTVSQTSGTPQPSDGSIKLQALWQNLKRYPRVFGYYLALTSGILLYGYDMAMTGNLASLPEFQCVLPPISNTTL